MKLIDRQFQETITMYMYLILLMTIYTIFFIAGLFFYDHETKGSLFICAAIFQIIFFVLEILEIRVVTWKEYVGDYEIWNISDLLFMVTFVGHVFYYYWGDVEEKKNKYLAYSCITIAHLFTLILKFMQYIRIFEKFSFLVEMII